MDRFTTVLFDLDGTIVDTNELIIQSFLHTLEGITEKLYTREDIIPHMGFSLYEQIKFFTGRTEVEELVKKYRAFNISKHDELVKEFPFVHDTLAALKAGGKRIGVVTNKMRMTTLMGLKLTGLDVFMDTIVTADDVAKGKPDPEMVVKALTSLGIPASEAVMVGDSQYDIQAAQQAGVASVGVGWSLKGEVHLRQFNPTYVIHDIREMLEIVGVKREEP